jgi:hypothetical protein
MSALPNSSIPLVGRDGRPTSPLLDLIPNLSAQSVVVNPQGQGTPLFLALLQGIARTPLPGVSAALVNKDGTPTRVMTHLLAGLG